MPSPSRRSYGNNAEISPDGVPIEVVWSVFVVGASVFIPAINLTKLSRQMQAAAASRGMRVQWRERIEGGKLGMRFWRTL